MKRKGKILMALLSALQFIMMSFTAKAVKLYELEAVMIYTAVFALCLFFTNKKTMNIIGLYIIPIISVVLHVVFITMCHDLKAIMGLIFVVFITIYSIIVVEAYSIKKAVN